MINAQNIEADFQLYSTQIKNFILNTSLDKHSSEYKGINFDYDIVKIDKTDGKYIGELDFFVKLNAQDSSKNILTIDMCMAGIFKANINSMNEDLFYKMVERNGLITLSQLTRSYLLGVTALSGINPPIKLPMLNVLDLIKIKNQ